MNVVEFAAYLIVGKTFGELVFKLGASKRRRIEARAAKLECEASLEAEKAIDTSQPEWMVRQWREQRQERRRQLLIRYPPLTAPPDRKFFKQARAEDEAEAPSLRERWEEDWKWWVYFFAALWFIPLLKLLWSLYR